MITGPAGARIARRTAELALSITAVLGACCLLIALAGVIFDIRPLIFRSGSMSPAIPAGSLALADQVPAAAARTGDVVSVPYRESRVTHRVVEVRPISGGRTELWLKGDANRSRDAEPYRVRTVDRVLVSVPVAGRAVAWLSRPPGVFVLAGYAAVLVAVLIRRRPDSGSGRGSDPGERRAGPAAAGPPAASRARRAVERRIRAGFGALLLGGTGSLLAAPSWASFTDTVPVSGTTITAYRIPAPTVSCGGLGLLSVTIRWAAVPQATRYTVSYVNQNGNQTTTTTNLSYTITTVGAVTGQARVVADRVTGTNVWSSAMSNVANYRTRLGLVSTCSTAG